MSLSPIIRRALPGTAISIFHYPSNPAEDTEQEDIFLDGYDEVIVRCDGQNPCFPKAEYHILVVRAEDNKRRPTLHSPDSEFITVIGDHDVEIVEVDTVVLPVPPNDQRVALIIVALRSPIDDVYCETFRCHDVTDDDMTDTTRYH